MSPPIGWAGFQILPILQELPETITEISLDFFSDISDSHVEFLISKWGKNLRTLSLRGAKKISDNLFKKFPQSFPTLHTLNLSWFDQKNFFIFFNLKFPRNVELAPDILIVLCNLPSLKNFFVRGCPKIQSHIVELKNMVKKNYGDQIKMSFSPTEDEKILVKIPHEENCQECPNIKCSECGVTEKKCQLSLVFFSKFFFD
jgi:hypothetical protein